MSNNSQDGSSNNSFSESNISSEPGDLSSVDSNNDYDSQTDHFQNDFKTQFQKAFFNEREEFTLSKIFNIVNGFGGSIEPKAASREENRCVLTILDENNQESLFNIWIKVLSVDNKQLAQNSLKMTNEIFEKYSIFKRSYIIENSQETLNDEQQGECSFEKGEDLLISYYMYQESLEDLLNNGTTYSYEIKWKIISQLSQVLNVNHEGFSGFEFDLSKVLVIQKYRMGELETEAVPGELPFFFYFAIDLIENTRPNDDLAKLDDENFKSLMLCLFVNCGRGENIRFIDRIINMYGTQKEFKEIFEFIFNDNYDNFSTFQKYIYDFFETFEPAYNLIKDDNGQALDFYLEGSSYKASEYDSQKDGDNFLDKEYQIPIKYMRETKQGRKNETLRKRVISPSAIKQLPINVNMKALQNLRNSQIQNNRVDPNQSGDGSLFSENKSKGRRGGLLLKTTDLKEKKLNRADFNLSSEVNPRKLGYRQGKGDGRGNRIGLDSSSEVSGLQSPIRINKSTLRGSKEHNKNLVTVESSNSSQIYTPFSDEISISSGARNFEVGDQANPAYSELFMKSLDDIKLGSLMEDQKNEVKNSFDLKGKKLNVDGLVSDRRRVINMSPIILSKDLTSFGTSSRISNQVPVKRNPKKYPHASKIPVRLTNTQESKIKSPKNLMSPRILKMLKNQKPLANQAQEKPNPPKGNMRKLVIQNLINKVNKVDQEIIFKRKISEMKRKPEFNIKNITQKHLKRRNRETEDTNVGITSKNSSNSNKTSLII